MLRFTLKGHNAWRILLPPILTLITFGLIAPLRDLHYNKIIFLPAALNYFTMLAMHITPPSVILLASSRWESIRLFSLIERGIYPYRVVALFEPSMVGRSRHSNFQWISFEFDNLRIVGSHDWREVVYSLTDLAPLIVLDTRFVATAVVEETRRILEDKLSDKALFIATDNDIAPTIDETNLTTSLEDLRLSRFTDVVKKLKIMGLSQTSSPDDNPLISKLTFSQNSKKLGNLMWKAHLKAEAFETSLINLKSRIGYNDFVQSAYIMLKKLGGSPGDGALEVYAHLSEDIATIELFINQWANNLESEYYEVNNCLIKTYNALCALQRKYDAAPPSFIIENEIALKGDHNKYICTFCLLLRHDSIVKYKKTINSISDFLSMCPIVSHEKSEIICISADKGADQRSWSSNLKVFESNDHSKLTSSADIALYNGIQIVHQFEIAINQSIGEFIIILEPGEIIRNPYVLQKALIEVISSKYVLAISHDKKSKTLPASAIFTKNEVIGSINSESNTLGVTLRKQRIEEISNLNQRVLMEKNVSWLISLIATEYRHYKHHQVKVFNWT